MYVLIICCLLVIMFVIVFERKSNDIMNKWLGKNKNLIDGISKIFIGGIAVFVAVQANEISQKQTNNEIIETAPNFEISNFDYTTQDEQKEAYKLTNKKGLASYLSFYRSDKYEFLYKSHPVSLTLLVKNTYDEEEVANQWHYVPQYNI